MRLLAPTPLADHHMLDAFNSGIPSLDDWLKKRARTNHASGASRTIVVATEDSTVVGYYALAASSISCVDASGRFRRNMPDPIPVITLGRLAVDVGYQKLGLGRDLVQDAGKRVLAAADLIGIRGLIVHAINEDAKSFYLARGLSSSPTNEMTLMVSLADLKASL